MIYSTLTRIPAASILGKKLMIRCFRQKRRALVVLDAAMNIGFGRITLLAIGFLSFGASAAPAEAATIPGIRLDALTDLGGKAVRGAGDLGNKLENLGKFADSMAKFLNERRQYHTDQTLLERRQRILAQLFALTDASQAVHDATLPDCVGCFLDAIHPINLAAVALQAEMNSLTNVQQLRDVPPTVFENSAINFLTEVGKASREVKERLEVKPTDVYIGNVVIKGEVISTAAELAVGVRDLDLDSIDSGELPAVLDLASAAIDLEQGALKVGKEITVGHGGLLTGNGTLDAPSVILGGGTISPGQSPGAISFTGDFLMRTGDILMEVAGTEPSLFDQLVFGGEADFTAGTIQVKLLDGFTLTNGASVPLFVGAAPFDFSGVELDFIGFDGTLTSTGELRLSDTTGGGNPPVGPTPIPVPPTIALGLAGLLSLIAAGLRPRASARRPIEREIS